MTGAVIFAVLSVALIAGAYLSAACAYGAAIESGALGGRTGPFNPMDAVALRFAVAALVFAILAGGLIDRALLIAFHLGATA